MGLIERMMGVLFGGGGNVIKETVEVFRQNAEAAARRGADQDAAALEQFAAEFARTQQRGFFDRLMDALNRLPRPAMALGTLGLFVAAMVDPVWFSARMQGIAIVPEPLWWLFGAIVSFYFGARHQAKGQEFQKSVAEALIRTPQILRNLQALTREETASDRSGFPERPVPPSAPAPTATQAAPDGRSPMSFDNNPALAEWKARNGY